MNRKMRYPSFFKFLKGSVFIKNATGSEFAIIHSPAEDSADPNGIVIQDGDSHSFVPGFGEDTFFILFPGICGYDEENIDAKVFFSKDPADGGYKIECCGNFRTKYKPRLLTVPELMKDNTLDPEAYVSEWCLVIEPALTS